MAHHNGHDRVQLRGDEAISLYLQGRDAWNTWVERNPEADVSFVNVNFAQAIPQASAIDFSHFAFPNSSLDFLRAQFSEEEVSLLLRLIYAVHVLPIMSISVGCV